MRCLPGCAAEGPIDSQPPNDGNSRIPYQADRYFGVMHYAAFGTGFYDIELNADGTFDDFDEGTLEGAFFDPRHEETAGAFHKNSNKVTGSFGAANRN